jgi:hypothetical protein
MRQAVQRAAVGLSYAALCLSAAYGVNPNAGTVPETNRRTKLSLYCLFTFHYTTVRAHLIEYDIKTLQYVLRTEAVRFPSAGLHRTHHAAIKGGSGGNILSGTAAGELIVINEVGRLFRASLPVTSNGMLSLLSIGDDVCVFCPQFRHQQIPTLALAGTQAAVTAASNGCRAQTCIGRQLARR